MSNPVSIYEAEDNRIRRNLLAHIRYALQYRAFFVYWVRRGLITRYSQTSVGFLWAIFQPLLSSLVYLIVFSVVARVSTEPVPYPLFIVTSLVLWSYFNRIVFSGAASIIGNLDIITRVQFPREFLPLSVAIEAVVDLLFGIIIIAIFFVIYQHPITPFILLAIPIFAIQTMLALGLAFFLAAMSTMIRDLFQVLPILLQLLLYVSPVLYPLDIVPGSIRAL
ncbi:MAG: ABC transporter permease, partial [Anaerolineae bacterium]|nr:ABC transporter permease [Anaerolineae bacterium]